MRQSERGKEILNVGVTQLRGESEKEESRDQVEWCVS